MPSSRERLQKVTTTWQRWINQARSEGATTLTLSKQDASLILGVAVNTLKQLENTRLTIAISSNEVAFAVDTRKEKINPKIEDIDWREMGQKMWKDLIDGYTSSQKDVTRWRNTYWFLATVVQAGYAHTDMKSALSQVTVSPKLLSDPYQGVLRSIQETGGLYQVELELEDLHLAAGIIYHLIIPGSQAVLGSPPEAIGSAATSRL